MIGLMPFMGGADKGLWTYQGQVATGTSSLTLPSDLQDGDFGFLAIYATATTSGSNPPANGFAFLPSGWSEITATSGTAFTPPIGENGEGTTRRTSIILAGRALTAAMSSTVLSGLGNGSVESRLYLFRNTQKRTPVLTLLDNVTGVMASRLVSFGAAGSPVIAGLASTASAGSPTLNGGAWPNSIAWPNINALSFALQKPGQNSDVAHSGSGKHRAFSVGLL